MTVRKSVFWSFFGQGLSSIVAFASSVFLARLLTPHEFGIFAVAIAAQGILQVFTTFSVGAYVVRQGDLTEDVIASAFTVNALISVGLSALIVTISFFGAQLLNDAAAGYVLRWLALGPLIGILTFRPAAMLQREMAFQTIAIIGVGNVLVISATTLSSAWLGASYMSAAYGLVAGAAFQALTYSLVATRHVSLRVSFERWRDIVKFGLNIASVSGVSVMMARLSEVILGRTLGLAALGLYGRAANIAAILADNIYGTATKISYVKLAQDARDHGDLRPTFLRSIHLIVGLLWPMQLGLAVLAGPVIRNVYGEQWLVAAVPMSLLMIAQCVSLAVGMNWELFALRNEMYRQTKLELMRSVIGFVLFVSACQFGLVAAAAARIVEALFSIVIYHRHVGRLARTQPGELFHIYRQNAVLAIVAVIPAIAVMTAFRWSTDVALSYVGLAICAGIGLWIAAIAYLHHPIYQEGRIFWSSLKNRLPRRRVQS